MRTRHFFAIALATLLSVTACTEDIRDQERPNQLRISMGEAQDSATFTRVSYSELATTFTSGDKVGIYAVKGTTVVNANVPYEFDGTEWTTSEFVEYCSAYTYYAYYPYVESPYAPDFTQPTVDSKFALFIDDASNKFHHTDQSSQADFNASDLMIAQGTETGAPRTVHFSMYHKKGLLRWTGEDIAYAAFTGSNIPHTSGERMYYHAKGGVSTSFVDANGYNNYSVAGGKYHDIYYTIPWVYTFTVSNPTTSYGFSGGSSSYSITSYKTNIDGTVTLPVEWYAQYQHTGSSDKPSWLTFTGNGAGSTSPTAYTMEVAEAELVTTDPTPTSILRAATTVSNYDLSTKGGTVSRTTANCYMVHAPGTYRIPLVYGNAIKNGSTNSAAYNPTGTAGTNFLKPFINHAGTGITNPWLKNNSAQPDAAELLWQDAEGLIASSPAPAISGDYLTFTVPAATIAEGNAVIAVKKGSDIVWSWHIWITPQDTYSTLYPINNGATNYWNMAPVNLGWVSDNKHYGGRQCIITIVQQGSGRTESFTVSQEEQVIYAGRSPYYQYGRKDPCDTGNLYVIDGTQSFAFEWKEYDGGSTGSAYGNIQNGIKYPQFLYNSDSYPTYSSAVFDTQYYNLWDGANTTVDESNQTGKVTKTIYDPCPPGFCMPRSGVFYFITTTSYPGQHSWDYTLKAYKWTGTNGSDGTYYTFVDHALLFHTCGNLPASWGSVSQSGSGTEGSYNIATPSSQISDWFEYSRMLSYFKSGQTVVLSGIQATAISVRPIADD